MPIFCSAARCQSSSSILTIGFRGTLRVQPHAVHVYMEYVHCLFDVVEEMRAEGLRLRQGIAKRINCGAVNYSFAWVIAAQGDNSPRQKSVLEKYWLPVQYLPNSV